MGFIINGKLQYLYRFYPSGEVIHLKEYRKETNQVIFNWYEKNGELAGQYIATNKPIGQMRPEDNVYYWKGKRVSKDEYAKNITPYSILSIQ